MRSEKFTSAYIGLMLTAFILFTGPGGYVLLARKKFIFFAVLTSIWAVAVLVSILKEKNTVLDRREGMTGGKSGEDLPLVPDGSASPASGDGRSEQHSCGFSRSAGRHSCGFSRSAGRHSCGFSRSAGRNRRQADLESSRLSSLIRIPPVLKFTVLYVILCTVSTLASEHPVFFGFGTGRYNGLATYLLYGVIFAGVYLYGRLEEWHLLAFFGAASVCSIIVLLQYAGLDPLKLYPDGLDFRSPYIQQVYLFLGTLGNVDILSSLNCLAIPASICSFTHISPKRRFVPVISAVLGLGSAFAASVQSGWLALAATLTVYLYIQIIVQKKDKKSSARKLQELSLCKAPSEPTDCPELSQCMETCEQCGCRNLKEHAFESDRKDRLHLFLPAAVLALLAAACFIAVFILPGEAGSSRIIIWKSSLEVFREHPVLGIGPDCLSDYSDVVFKRFSQELGRELSTACDNAHCELLHHLVSFGIAGLIPLAGAAVSVSKNISSHFLAPAVFCYAVQSFFNLGLPIVTPVFIIFLALCSRESSSFQQDNMIE